MGILNDQLTLISNTAKAARREAAQKQLDAAFEWLSAVCVGEAEASNETATCCYFLVEESAWLYTDKYGKLVMPREVDINHLLQLLKERFQQEAMNLTWKDTASSFYVTARWGSKNQ